MNKIFQNFLRKIDKAADAEKQNVVDEFISQVKKSGYPIYETKNDVVLLYQGNEEKIEILGDMTDWDRNDELIHLPKTNLHYIKYHLESDACLEYWFVNNDKVFVDPLNPFKLYNAIGDLSEVAMPDYKRHPILAEYVLGKKGSYNNVTKLNLPAGILPYEHEVFVYLPEEYNQAENNYPVIYFQDGRDYLEYAVVPHVLDSLIAQNKIKPVIAIFVNPPNRHQPDTPNRMTEYGLNDDYVSFFSDELVPFIDENYRTKKEAPARIVAGDSYGGLISTYIAFQRPDVFGNAISQSGYHCFQKNKMIELIKASPRKNIFLFVDTGTYEKVVGKDILPEGERDFITANRELHEVLIQKEYKHIYREFHEGHTWGNWRRHLIDALIHFYGNKAGEV